MEFEEKNNIQLNFSSPGWDKPSPNKQMIKNKSLKEEFSQLLDFPIDHSYKAFSENKEKNSSLKENSKP